MLPLPAYGSTVLCWTLPLFQFLGLIDSRQDSLDGGSASRKTATCTQNRTSESAEDPNGYEGANSGHSFQIKDFYPRIVAQYFRFGAVDIFMCAILIFAVCTLLKKYSFQFRRMSFPFI
jgi:hypothetical protein